MNILYLSSHAVLEYDQIRLWTGLGHDVFSIGAYTSPRQPTVNLRPPLESPDHPDLAALCVAQREKHAGEPVTYPIIDWAKADLHTDLIDWADAVIVDCYPESWLVMNWRRLRRKRVIWRTIGQSGFETETAMAPLRADGLEIVRYSPAEERAYGHYFAGSDAVIRFGKDPADWYGWTGEEAVVGNLAQHDIVPHARDPFLHWDWITAATAGLPFRYGGPNSEKTGGLGALGYDAMQAYLRRIRAYVYTGTIPASYTLGLIEAMMTGTIVVTMGAEEFGMADLFEAPEILKGWTKADSANEVLRRWLSFETGDEDLIYASTWMRNRAIELFGVETIAAQWQAFLGVRVAA